MKRPTARVGPEPGLPGMPSLEMNLGCMADCDKHPNQIARQKQRLLENTVESFSKKLDIPSATNETIGERGPGSDKRRMLIMPYRKSTVEVGLLTIEQENMYVSPVCKVTFYVSHRFI